MCHLEIGSGDGASTVHELDDEDARGEQVDVGVVDGELEEHAPRSRVQPVLLLQLGDDLLRAVDLSAQQLHVAAAFVGGRGGNVGGVGEFEGALVDPGVLLLLEPRGVLGVGRCRPDGVVGLRVVVGPAVLVQAVADEALHLGKHGA